MLLGIGLPLASGVGAHQLASEGRIAGESISACCAPFCGRRRLHGQRLRVACAGVGATVGGAAARENCAAAGESGGTLRPSFSSLDAARRSTHERTDVMSEANERISGGGGGGLLRRPKRGTGEAPARASWPRVLRSNRFACARRGA